MKAYIEEAEEQEQLAYVQMWVKKKALSRMQKLEKKLRIAAKTYYGEEVSIIYAQKGSVIVDKEGNEHEIDPTG